MKKLFDFPEKVIEFVKHTVHPNDESSIEKALLCLRENKVSQVQSVYRDIPFNKANLYVMNSKAWNGE